MKENESALYSHYIIDGVRFDMTPAEMLDECMEYEDGDNPEYEDFGNIMTIAMVYVTCATRRLR